MSPRALLRLAVLAALAALAVVPAAAAHGGGGALGFRSTITKITPATAGIGVQVLDSDDRLVLSNRTGKPLVIQGYEGEPYLAFRDGRVLRNARSPATYLNDDRFAAVEVPEKANPKAPPEWEEVAQKEEYEWHDHRIHWMSRILPPKVAAAKSESHHVFDWKVPGTLDGKPFAIAGSLDYEPPPGGNPTLLVGAAAVVLLGGAGAVVLRRRRLSARA
jgi:hypothetical protein